jgi:hypothetical protein
VPDGYSSNEQTANGRLIVLAVDQPNIPFTAVRSLRDTLNSFIDTLPAADRIAVIGFGARRQSVHRDRDRLKQAVRDEWAATGSFGITRGGLATAIRIDRDNKRISANEPPSPDLDRLANRLPPKTATNSSSRYVCEERSRRKPARSHRTRDVKPTRRFGRCKRCSPASRASTPQKH